MTTELPDATRFADLNLPDFLLRALTAVGYETPSAIQARTIPPLLEGCDLVGQAQTGTGKTAAFALPLLAGLDIKQKTPQVMVLTPTRELAIQVAEAFQKYAAYLPGFHVLPIYGGSDYRGQLRQLQRGVHVIVGTPGRVMDHMRRGSLDLRGLRSLVLDEADEMLRMGFIDDVEWILEQTPPTRQVALFSATMPTAIRRIAQQHLKSPREITIQVKSMANEAIRQRVWMMAGVHKLDALTRILEMEDFDAIIMFVRTRIATTELAEKLAARGYSAAPLNGDIPQQQREKTVERLKNGGLDILVATDVAARGLDVERISHVINYDIPQDVEAYVHRIGRTGRAGRKGEAILFAANRERRLLKAIERATSNVIEPMQLPSAQEVQDKRSDRFKQQITETLDTRDLDAARKLVSDYQHEYGVPMLDVAAALVLLAGGKADSPAPIAQNSPSSPVAVGREKPSRGDTRPPREARESRDKPRRQERDSELAKGMERFRIAVGHTHGVKPGNIVGAIANEADIDSEHIGRIIIHDSHSTVDLPEGMPEEIFDHLRNVWVSGQKLNLQRDQGATPAGNDKPATARKRTGKPGLKPDHKPGKRKPKA
ncbi:MAG TPA: ATP-dependent RNA helicase [Haliea salexigens]|uniref:ATP-dependent RNA helicase DeaD n=1 Tax=Haliea salexigens TaxID=287487 RepID=A0A3C1KQJ5_9GAMM|nr:ATP-dependent RNA helicase [Haliea sp.]HAN28758.1 ATP-dependent RNA helicase [Haliea salexigens]|tara:strand:- start:4635 stop:6434 length:1800 start_codon:yes stop_codon:yes gene_type:complete